MNQKTAATAYTEASYESAPPIKIIHMMYEGALRFIEQAEELDPKADHRRYNDFLNRADAVICELRLSLKHEQAPDLADKLNALYLFAEEQIREAFLERKKEPLAAAKGVLSTLLEGWKQVEVRLEDAA